MYLSKQQKQQVAENSSIGNLMKKSKVVRTVLRSKEGGNRTVTPVKRENKIKQTKNFN